ncbi:MAG: sigma-70 family RNA polymerase sigma factor [Bryobacteraceae bacterium]
MAEPLPNEVTELLRRLSAGDRSAENELLPHVYGELKRLAVVQLRRERPGHTLQATALVHEAYMRLAINKPIPWHNRLHFLAMAGKLMRQILVDHGRRRNAEKRGGPEERIPFDDNIDVSDEQCVLVTGLDDALKRLAKEEPRKAEIVELRYFGGLTEEEIAELLGISVRTVKRDWALAKAWLYGELST